MKVKLSLLLFSLQFLSILRAVLNVDYQGKQEEKEDKKTKKNPYMVKFHATASRRPTKCQGIWIEFLEKSLEILNSS